LWNGTGPILRCPSIDVGGTITDIVLLNLSSGDCHLLNTLINDHIFVLEDHDRLLVRRAKEFNEGWYFISERNSCPPIRKRDQTYIRGEVKWTARML
jgi:hypothetical protein